MQLLFWKTLPVYIMNDMFVFMIKLTPVVCLFPLCSNFWKTMHNFENQYGKMPTVSMLKTIYFYIAYVLASWVESPLMFHGESLKRQCKGSFKYYRWALDLTDLFFYKLLHYFIILYTDILRPLQAELRI